MIAGKIVRKKRIENINIEKIVLGKFTLRKHFNEEKISQLAESVKNFGILQPVTVRKFGKTYELISGERRVRAAKKAGISSVPAIIVDTRFDIAAAMAIAENQQREELYLLDAAESFMALIRRRGLTYSEMAEIIGVSAKQVSEKVELLQLPRKVREVLSKHNLTKEHIDAVSNLKTEEAAWLLSEAAEKGFSPHVITEKAKALTVQKLVRKQVVKDVRIYVNTIEQAIEKIRKAGAYAHAERHDNDQYTEYIIKIEK